MTDAVINYEYALRLLDDKKRELLQALVEQLVARLKKTHPNVRFSEANAFEVLLKTWRWVDEPQDYRPRWQDET